MKGTSITRRELLKSAGAVAALTIPSPLSPTFALTDAERSALAPESNTPRLREGGNPNEVQFVMGLRTWF